MMAYVSRIKVMRETLKKYKNENKDNKENNKLLIITERSLYTDKMVFAKMLYEAENISSIEWETYNYWYNSFMEISQVDTIIYISTDPQVCYNRIKNRNRSGESNIPLDYLTNCHMMHENWINNTNTRVIKLDGNKSIEELQNNIKQIMKTLIPSRTETICSSE
jgi:deoxyadenosine/deoxycytidine kinase